MIRDDDTGCGMMIQDVTYSKAYVRMRDREVRVWTRSLFDEVIGPNISSFDCDSVILKHLMI